MPWSGVACALFLGSGAKRRVHCLWALERGGMPWSGKACAFVCRPELWVPLKAGMDVWERMQGAWWVDGSACKGHGGWMGGMGCV